MAERLEWFSPLALTECIRRLELLSLQPVLLTKQRSKVTRVVVSRFTAVPASDDSLEFRLNARCHDYTYRRLGGRQVGTLEQLHTRTDQN